MTLFFMISGFVLCAQQKNFDIKKQGGLLFFYKKKIFSIIPLYLFVYLLFTVVNFGSSSIGIQVVLFPIEFLLIQSYVSGLFAFLHNGATWFISCLIFCLFFAPFFLIIFQIQTQSQRRLSFLVCYFFAFYPPIAVYLLGVDSVYDNPIFRCAEFLSGMLLYYSFERLQTFQDKQYNYKLITLFLSVLFIITITLLSWFHVAYYAVYDVIVVPFFSLIILFGTYAWKKCCVSFFCRLITFYNAIAYEFFLAQFFTWDLSKYIIEFSCIPDTNICRICLSFIVCTLIAILFSKLITVPAKQYLSKRYL